jgi:Family of unknown function (DUF6152)
MKCDRTKAVQVAVLGTLLVGLAAPISAHHSGAMFDRSKVISLEGTVMKAEYGNPHSIYELTGKEVGVDNAPVKKWVLEAQNPNIMLSNGLKPDTIKVGDKISVTGYARKDGKPYISVATFTDTNGKVYQQCAQFPCKKESY